MHNILTASWPEQAGILEGILFGDSSGISAKTLEMYKAAGVMHVFAASGSNVAFVMALAWLFLFGLPRKARIAATIGVILCYAVLCSGNLPILRATILGTSVLIGRLLGSKKISMLRWLLFAALILYLWNPLFLRDIGFQLSFAATWGMLVLSPRLIKNAWFGKLPELLRLPAAASFGAQIAVLPIMTNVFHKLSLAGLITNIFILFMLGGVLQLGLIGTVLSFVPGMPPIFFQAAVWLLEISDRILTLIASFPWAYFWVLNPGMIFWIAWYVFLAGVLFGTERIKFIWSVQIRRLISAAKRLRLLPCLSRIGDTLKLGKAEKLDTNQIKPRYANLRDVILQYVKFRYLFALLLILLLWNPWSSGNALKITFIDVGQGDCILIQTARENLLVDTGPRKDNYNAAEKIVLPYLMEKRIGKLDFLFITHEDADHLGGAQYLLANLPVAKVAVPEAGDRITNEEWQSGIPAEYYRNEGKFVTLKAGDYIHFSSSLQIDIMAPVEEMNNTGADSNNNSLVIQIEYLGKKILLTGDMEAEEMESISDRGTDWNSDFIKIPHHGGKGSLDTAWFDSTNPRAVFVSVGKNSFGHPSREVINYWEERGVPIYRTDIDGTIQLMINKKSSKIITGR
ncbi:MULTISPECIES: ComEC/Rec2 family competence protein [unclassified Dehalobacter]|uniref:ComEC/Rec2 family competence protein n=1 Tax=unclassified Dehalobacter TaxID=2635733 RepID=UPI001FA9F0C2|nr:MULTISPECIES: ComEC/Rec2 family competence protein [unclassified Dehalobacter]